MRAILFFAAAMVTGHVFALGNYPEANTCSQSQPYYAVCTAGSHDLQGWVGKCQATKEAAQKDADAHALKSHNGVTQWTGVTRISRSAKYENSGLPP